MATNDGEPYKFFCRYCGAGFHEFGAHLVHEAYCAADAAFWAIVAGIEVSA